MLIEVWEDGFSNRLRIRSASQHGKCNTCLKHKYIMKKLGADDLARAAQAKLWGIHLRQQFADRQTYWNNRSLSCLGCDIKGEKTICLIIDSMDRSKWAIPRSTVLSSKSFNGLARPVMDCTGVLCHGSLACVAFCEPHIAKGAEWTIELLSFVFNKLTESCGLDLRQYEVWIQADNASKEAKSNSVLRYLSYCVGRRRLRAARLSFCMSGHNHEDIDQYFSLLGSYLQTQDELHSADEFTNAIKRYMSNPSVRPLEACREVVKIDAVRAWIPSVVWVPLC